MKTLVRIVLSFLALALAVFAVAYVDGSMLPVNHTVSITGIIPATPARTFAIITDVGGRGRDHWIEDLGHNMKMDFVATATEPCSSEGHALRTILLNDPSYGGTWTYELTPGPTAGSTTLKITETGFINPPIYRFMMAHLFGPTRNLNIYMKDLQKKAI
jgi:hypothetical protein